MNHSIKVRAIVTLAAALITLLGGLLVSPAEAYQSISDAYARDPHFRRVGLRPPSCDSRRTVLLSSRKADDATIRHNQLVHWTEHNFKGYLKKPRCALVRVDGAP